MRKLSGINLVIASGSEKARDCLLESFTRLEANVVLCGFLNLDFVSLLEQETSADVILIDMNDAYEEDEQALDRLLERVDLPILFHDNDFDELNDPEQGCGFTELAIDKLAEKLANLVQSHEKKAKAVNEDRLLDENESETRLEENAESEIDPFDELVLIYDEVREDISAEQESDEFESVTEEIIQPIREASEYISSALLEQESALETLGETQKAPLNIWVLGSSIGGPEALKRFFARLPAELPVGFIVAQHLGDGFVSLLAEQLDRAGHFKVKEAEVGDTIQHGEAIVVPVEQRMTLDDKGRVGFSDEPWKGHYKPSIDCVIKEVTGSFKNRSGVIIFSGMGADGVLACQQFSDQHQGTVWAQTTDTCVISSMPDSVRKADLVSYSGSPEALALKISIRYMGKEQFLD